MELNERQQQIHNKGFVIGAAAPTDFSAIKVGIKTLDDAVMNLGDYKKANARGTIKVSKEMVLKALAEGDIELIREYSDHFYKVSGIYQMACNYLAFLYRYDWYIAPEVVDENVKMDKVTKEFSRIMNYFDSSHIKKICGEIALEVVKKGIYYGIIIPSADQLMLQQLPAKYCRARYKSGNWDAIEFDMRYFDDNFRDPAYRMKVLGLFPKDIQKGYMLFKQNKLPTDIQGDRGSWYLLEPGSAVKFDLYGTGGSGIPCLASSIPSIMDLDEAQALDKKKQMQKLLKILVQKLPRDKNGDLIFDNEEAFDLHNNAVQMLKRAVGVDVLTTFADVEALDMADRNSATTTDDLKKIERAVFNSMGISQNLFNTDGNLSLTKSIQQDEATMRNLLLQFHIFFDMVLSHMNSQKKKYIFKFYMLETTQYNYQELSKMYKDQVQIGYSKMLPQIALGHTQSSILNMVKFENEILELYKIMIPPLASNVMNAEMILGTNEKSDQDNNQKNLKDTSGAAKAIKVAETDTKEAGRPAKAEDQKSEKTMQNIESMN